MKYLLCLFVFPVLMSLGCKEKIIYGPDKLIDPNAAPEIELTYPPNNGVGPFNIYNPGDGYGRPHFILQFSKLMNASTIAKAIHCEGFDRPIRVQLSGPVHDYDQLFLVRISDTVGFYEFRTSLYRIGRKYTITIDTTVEDITGRHPRILNKFSFLPEPYFRIVSWQPKNGTVTQSASVFPKVTFNSVITSSILPWLQLLPRPSGLWEIYPSGNDSSTALFFAYNGFSFSTNYTLEVAAGATDKYGNTLLQPQRTSFTTPAFMITRIYPLDQSVQIPFTTVVAVSFTGNLDTQSVHEAFSLEPSISGRFEFYSPVDQFHFLPDGEFRAQTRYTVSISTALKAFNGTHLSAPFSFSFVTDSFYVVQTIPRNGEVGVGRQKTISVGFNARYDTSLARSSVSITPPAQLRYLVSDYGGSVNLVPDSALAANTFYRITISSDMRSKGGNKMNNPYTFSFTTGN